MQALPRPILTLCACVRSRCPAGRHPHPRAGPRHPRLPCQVSIKLDTEKTRHPAIEIHTVSWCQGRRILLELEEVNRGRFAVAQPHVCSTKKVATSRNPVLLCVAVLLVVAWPQSTQLLRDTQAPEVLHGQSEVH